MNQLALDLQPATPEYRTIPLSKGQVAIVDTDDYDRLCQFKWYAIWNRRTRSFYAKRNLPKINGKQPTSWMHREIVNAVIGERVDHRDHSTLDNRKSNLRRASATQNSQNQSLRGNNTSGYKGVSWNKRRGKFEAYICVNKIQIRLGYFDSAKDGGTAYQAAAIKYFGEFAYWGQRQ